MSLNAVRDARLARARAKATNLSWPPHRRAKRPGRKTLWKALGGSENEVRLAFTKAPQHPDGPLVEDLLVAIDRQRNPADYEQDSTIKFAENDDYRSQDELPEERRDDLSMEVVLATVGRAFDDLLRKYR